MHASNISVESSEFSGIENLPTASSPFISFECEQTLLSSVNISVVDFKQVIYLDEGDLWLQNTTIDSDQNAFVCNENYHVITFVGDGNSIEKQSFAVTNCFFQCDQESRSICRSDSHVLFFWLVVFFLIILFVMIVCLVIVILISRKRTFLQDSTSTLNIDEELGSLPKD